MSRPSPDSKTDSSPACAPDLLQTPHHVLDRGRAEFADPFLEAQFLRHTQAQRNAQLRTSLQFGAVFYVAFGATDFATLGDTPTAWLLLVLRVAVALAALAGCRALRRWPQSAGVSYGTASSFLTLALAVFMLVCWYQPQALPWNVMSQALIIMAVYGNFPNRFLYAVAIGTISSAVFGAMLLAQGHLAFDGILTLALLLVMGNALGLVAARRLHLAERQQFYAGKLLQHMADRDPLTGCYNRRLLQTGLLDAELVRARRYGAPVAVILCDIDHFKRINDSHGHAVGDLVLIAFASLLQRVTRTAVDSVIRYGGEEFLVVLPETSLAGAHTLAERIRVSFADEGVLSSSGERLYFTASFGVAAWAGQADAPTVTPEQLIGAADVQLYDAKRAGRNAVRSGVLQQGAPAPQG